MALLNENYLNLAENYLFADIKKKVDAFLKERPGAKLIRLGIGDVTLPLTPAVIAALHRATEEMSDAKTFHGYGPEQGYEFLRNAIVKHEYRQRGVAIEADEIFVSDGAKCDVGNIQEIFSTDAVVAIADPVYPVYLDSNIMAGRKIVFLPSTRENSFTPELPDEKVDLVYLCSPNNPTGTVMSGRALQKWVDFARENSVILLFDSAYNAYIRDPELPRSIYEIPGAEECAIEFKSFSKNAGFTGLRCAYTVVPKALTVKSSNGKMISLNALWNRRQCTKFNGVSYVVQRAAEAVYSEQGITETQALVDYYMENASIIFHGMSEAGFEVYGGKNSPYIWWHLPQGTSSMNFLNTLLHECEIVGTPGVGFGSCGEGYFRLTAFGDREQTREAVTRIVAKKEPLLKQH